MYSYVARQPILDSNLNTIGYELLFREGGSNNTFPGSDVDHATSRLLLEQFLGSGETTAGDKTGFVNFSHDSIIGFVPTLFPKENIIVEVANDSRPKEELLWAIMQLKRQGYRVALDNFIPSAEWRKFLPYVDFIKFDIQSLPLDKISVFVNKLEKSKIEFIAQKVETYQEYHKVKDLGFRYFQGYFFSKPEIISNKDISPSHTAVLKLCEDVADKDIDYRKLEKTFASDVSLSYKMLRYVNSAANAVRISSLHQALAYLGEEKIRKLISVFAMGLIAETKPEPLLTLSVQRANFCELLVKETQFAGDEEVNAAEAYLVGLFSLLDALLDTSMDRIVHSVSLNIQAQDALISRQGVLGNVLLLAIAYERAEWDKVAQLINTLGVSEEHTNSCFKNALPMLTADVL